MLHIIMQSMCCKIQGVFEVGNCQWYFLGIYNNVQFGFLITRHPCKHVKCNIFKSNWQVRKLNLKNFKKLGGILRKKKLIWRQQNPENFQYSWAEISMENFRELSWNLLRVFQSFATLNHSEIVNIMRFMTVEYDKINCPLFFWPLIIKLLFFVPRLWRTATPRRPCSV